MVRNTPETGKLVRDVVPPHAPQGKNDPSLPAPTAVPRPTRRPTDDASRSPDGPRWASRPEEAPDEGETVPWDREEEVGWRSVSSRLLE